MVFQFTVTIKRKRVRYAKHLYLYTGRIFRFTENFIWRIWNKPNTVNNKFIEQTKMQAFSKVFIFIFFFMSFYFFSSAGSNIYMYMNTSRDYLRWKWVICGQHNFLCERQKNLDYLFQFFHLHVSSMWMEIQLRLTNWT